MSAKIIRFTGLTTLDLEPDGVLDDAKEAGLTGVVVLGFMEGEKEYFASSLADGGAIIWLLERLKARILA